MSRNVYVAAPRLVAELDELIPQPDFCRITGWDRSSIWHMRKRAENPIPCVEIGSRVYFNEAEVLE